jgi:hypothetical protein
MIALQNDSLKNTAISLPIVEYRYEVIEGVKSKISNLLNDQTFIGGLADTADSVGPSVAGGGILAVVGGVITAVTRVVFLDVLGTVFLGVGVLFAGGVLFAQRRRLIQKLDSELARNQERFEFTVSEQLNAKLSVIYEEIDRSFADLYTYVNQERTSIAPLIKQFGQLQQSTQTLAREIQQL